VDPWIQIFGLLGQLMFYGGLLVLLVGFPVFIWLWIRMCRDIHWISRALWAHYDLAKRAAEHGHPSTAPLPKPNGEISTSMFGR
jgi:hypothetical protein